MQQCKTISDGITFDDFKRIMKGQPNNDMVSSNLSTHQSKGWTESVNSSSTYKLRAYGSLANTNLIEEESLSDESLSEQRSLTPDFETCTHWKDMERAVTYSFVPPPRLFDEDEDSVAVAKTLSPLVANRKLQRRHREMRLAVHEASKRFDIKRTERQSKEEPAQAGLIMKRGATPPVELEDAHTRALFEAAARRCGRSRRNQTVSDVTGMLVKAPVE